MRTFLILSALCALAACKRGPAAEPADKVASRAARILPADARLAGLYRASCQNCHGHPESGAPPAGYAFAWAPRLAQGGDVLLAHTIGGYNGMPAGGQCFACTAADYRQLIAFMSAAPDAAAAAGEKP